MEAFERYLREAETVERETEVRQRIDALRKTIAEKEATERKLEAARLRFEDMDRASSRRRANKRDKAKPEAAETDVRPVSTSLAVPESASRPTGVDLRLPEYETTADEPTAKKKKWPWIVAAAAVVVAGGVTAGVVLSQRANQSPPTGSSFSVNW